MLSVPDFRRLLTVRLAAQSGDGALQVALAGLFFFSPQRAATAAAAAVAFTVAVLPFTLVGPFAGVLLDRWDRRSVMVRANLLRAVLVAGLVAVTAGRYVGPAVYVLVLASLSVNRFFLAGLGACLPRVVDRDELVMANSISPTSGTVAALLGGAGAYLVRLVVGPPDVGNALILVAVLALYLAAAGIAGRFAPGRLGPGQATHRPTGAGLTGVLAGLVEAARHVRARRPAFRALSTIGLHRFGYGLTTVASIIICRNRLRPPQDVDAGLALFGAVLLVSGAGFALAALATPAAVRRWSPLVWIIGCLVAAAGVHLVLAVWLSTASMLAGALVLGLTAQGVKICVDSIVQASVDDAVRGRVFAFYDVVFNAAFVLAATAAALILPADGYSPAVLVATAGLYLGTAIGYRVAVRR